MSRIPGKEAKQLRREQAKITARAVAGDADLEEAIGDRRTELSPAARTTHLEHGGVIED